MKFVDPPHQRRVGAQYDARRRLTGADARNHARHLFERAVRPVQARTPQLGDQQMRAAEHVERQIAVVIALGGSIALRLAAARPLKVFAVVLVDASPELVGSSALVTLPTRAGELSIRDAIAEDVDAFVSYWHESGDAHLQFLGIDRAKLGTVEDTRMRF